MSMSMSMSMSNKNSLNAYYHAGMLIVMVYFDDLLPCPAILTVESSTEVSNGATRFGITP